MQIFSQRRKGAVLTAKESVLIRYGKVAEENKLIIEIKSVEAVVPVHYKQVLTYLKLTNIKLGLLINFNEELIKTGIKRVVNGL